jgi:hypothetical protein
LGSQIFERPVKNLNDRLFYHYWPIVLPDIICSFLTALNQSQLPVYALRDSPATPLNACTLPHSGQILEIKAVLEWPSSPLSGGVKAFLGYAIRK